MGNDNIEIKITNNKNLTQRIDEDDRKNFSSLDLWEIGLNLENPLKKGPNKSCEKRPLIVNARP